MARKRLIKGPNAERVEKRIAQVPEDITETNIFKVLKEIEERSKASQPVETHTNIEMQPEKRGKEPSGRKPKRAVNGTTKTKHEQNKKSSPKPVKGKTSKNTTVLKSGASIKFTKSEKEIVIKSCKAYRNTLPIYLKSVQKEVKTIDGIIKKLTR